MTAPQWDVVAHRVARSTWCTRKRHSSVPARVHAAPDGEYLPIKKRRRKEIGPRLDLTHSEAVELQLAALRDNDNPYHDAGVELLYRFADLDPFARSSYFGWNLDLGQFTRFQRAFHITPFRLLLRHRHAEPLSTLQISEREWRQRFLVVGLTKEEAIFEITMLQRFGGLYDGVYYTKALRAESPLAQPM